MWWLLAREVLYLRNTPGMIRGQPWDVMVDLFLYRAPEEQEKDEAAQATEETPFQRGGFDQEGTTDWSSQPATGEHWEQQDWGQTGGGGGGATNVEWGGESGPGNWDSSVVGQSWDAQ